MRSFCVSVAGSLFGHTVVTGVHRSLASVAGPAVSGVPFSAHRCSLPPLCLAEPAIAGSFPAASGSLGLQVVLVVFDAKR